jgi:hypothetical protein
MDFQIVLTRQCYGYNKTEKRFTAYILDGLGILKRKHEMPTPYNWNELLKYASQLECLLENYRKIIIGKFTKKHLSFY